MSQELISNSTGSVEITSFDCIYGTTVRVWLNINGIPFKRIWDRSGLHQAVWHDIEYNVGDTLTVQGLEKQEELESIFKAFCLETNFDVVRIINNKK